MQRFPEILKEERKSHKLTQSALAEKLSCDRYRIADLERGKSSPSVEDLNLLCDYFEISADYLLGRTPVRAPDPDKTLQTIQQYTGLSEETISYLHGEDFPDDWPFQEEINTQNRSSMWSRIISDRSVQAAVELLIRSEEKAANPLIFSAEDNALNISETIYNKIRDCKMDVNEAGELISAVLLNFKMSLDIAVREHIKKEEGGI